MPKYTRFIILLLIPMIMAITPNKAEASDLPIYELHVRILPETHTLEGRAIIHLPADIKPYLMTSGLEIKKITINGRIYRTVKDSINELVAGRGDKTIEIDYAAVFSPVEIQESIENTGVIADNIIDRTRVMLLSSWYPAIQGTAIYRLTAEIPSDLEAISEADSSTARSYGGTKTVSFDFPHPTSGITLIAGKYQVHEEVFHGISIKTFFFPEDDNLSSNYIEHAKKYLEMYESMLGKYPYRSFSIVENSFQTGYSFPAYTLLGSRVIRLPFIVETSLGHEILHQWFGNYVYVDYKKGNWAEGLTTYLADQWYEHLNGRGPAYRKKILIDYMNYVNPENEISLKEFNSREDFSSKTIGYGTAAMVFHMLRKKLGDETFFSVLRNFVTTFRYRNASWDDIRDSFMSSGGKGLKQFFRQWVDRKGIPSFYVKNVSVAFRDGKYILSFDISQKGDVYNIDVPLKADTPGGHKEFKVTIDRKEVHFEKAFDERPARLVFDENYDVVRTLAESEKPPVISSFTGDKGNIVILPEKHREIYRDAAVFFKKQGFTIKGEKEITNKDIRNHSILIMSTGNRIYKRLFAGKPLDDAGFVLRVEENPLNSGKTAVIINSKNAEETRRACRKIFRYGNYSHLVFENGKNIIKETA
ncbi:MAG TPA: M1 family peptidase, partial [Nitrospirae bacterium]|nr:M1 family peptidase [Nitrospirota bacterium]